MYDLIPPPIGRPKVQWLGRVYCWTAYNYRIVYGVTKWRRERLNLRIQ